MTMMNSSGLVQGLAQKQVIGTQMQQSLQILQASALELQHLVQQELEINPVLEIEQEEPPQADADEDTQADEEVDEAVVGELEWDDYWADAPVPGLSQQHDNEAYDHAMESITGVTSLVEYLREQLHLWPDYDPRLVDLVESMIGLLDHRGFLSKSLVEIAQEHKVDYHRVIAAQQLLMQFDPPGIGAVDLRESLMVQLERQGKVKTLPWSVLDRCFDLLASRRLPQIAQVLEVDLEDVVHAASVISKLDPAPGQRFEATRDRYVTSDVIAEHTDEGWTAFLTSADVPKLRISNFYKDMLAGTPSSATREYLREKIKSGKLLISTIHQRQSTILRIAQEIIKRQQAFFEHGRAYLLPMTMAPVANELGVHETTISRAVAGKYMQTPHGLMELRSFFTHGVSTYAGPDVSNISVKQSLAAFIRAEDKRRPYSDDQLMHLLQGQGIRIARRTVAKYREQLGFPPSSMRQSFQ